MVNSWHSKASDRALDGQKTGTFNTATIDIESDYFCATGINVEEVEVIGKSYSMFSLSSREKKDANAVQGEVQSFSKVLIFILTSRSNVSYHDRKLAGLYPLNAFEVTRLLKALGAPRYAKIYWAEGPPFGGQEALIPLTREFPHLYNKEDIAFPGELETFGNIASLMEALDNIVFESNDVFMPSHGGNMGHAIQVFNFLCGMLEQLLIFTRGGLILWTCKELGNALKGSPIDTLIRSCLLEERSGDASYNYDAPGAAYTLKWTFHNELGLIFVAVYQRILHLLYVDDLLDMVKREFSMVYDPKRTIYYNDFDDAFRQLQKEAEARVEDLKKSNKQVLRPGSNNNVQSKKLAVLRSDGQKSNGSVKGGGDKDSSKGRKLENGGVNYVNGDTKKNKENGGSDASGAFDVNKLQKLRTKGGKKTDNNTVANKAAPKVETKKKITKKNRVWDEKPLDPKLDFTDPVEERGDEHVEAVAVNHGESMMDKEEVFSSDSESEEDEEEAGEGNKGGAKKKGWFSSMFQSIAGKTNLEKTDLEPALKALKDRLMTKNVAEEIAEKLCESVAANLVGKKLGSFTRISSTVQTAMEEALVRILTPKRSIDVLRDVHVAKEQGKPYVVVFVGVNGVGKSTNLAKVAYWLRQHDVSVMMAACDTFRSGAVEQLRTHARRLQIPIFEKGYEKDPAVVAKEAIQEATRIGSDVVIVDTAGRMQDNEPLMRALSKLIYLNSPDLVLFVGEALVGNDAVDQLSKFNQKLADLATSPNPRLIDGILLTKFDTIDDKVGAALSMVYISGAPVMFVGCGQRYPDLVKLNVKTIVRTLLK
ncbi:hypothetical protein IFM89_010487 [Coptis chinensis]|uniref:O-fucosyltransferase family protein n=1 Tax=Coptis chinensis TaxID=261450 RepID=A0A835IBJ2_9MAGN|nr:hypothetical protein IFM89_010487 [Coptis chinensis]